MTKSAAVRIKWLDAVRVFGLGLVLVYHLFYRVLPGGFLGVDIFLTFSGFLLTALAIEEFRTSKTFNLLMFCKRRLTRIAIPLFLSVAATLPLALLISNDFTVGIDRQLASVFSFTSNWYFISIGSSYEAQLLQPLYNHTWSISVLMQLYLAWGAIFAALTATVKLICRRTGKYAKANEFIRKMAIAAAACLAIGSYLCMQLLYNADYSLDSIYFNTFARAFTFFIGCISAALWGFDPKKDIKLKKHIFAKYPALNVKTLVATAALSCAMIVLMLSQSTFADEFVYRFGFLLTSLLTVALIYAAHALHILVPSVREPGALTEASKLSYEMFLVHWPVYIVASNLVAQHLLASVATLIISAALSLLLVNVVEKSIPPWNKESVLLLLASVRGLGKSESGPAGLGKRTLYKHIQDNRVVVVKLVRASAALIVTAAGIALSVPVVINAPPRTSIEADFAAGYIVGDVFDLVDLGLAVRDVNQSPVLYHTNGAPLMSNLMAKEAAYVQDLSPIEDTAAGTADAEDSPDASPAQAPGLPEPPAPEPPDPIPPEPMPEPPEPEPEPLLSEPEPELPEPEDPEPESPAPEPVPEMPAPSPIEISGGVSIIGDSVPLGASATLRSIIPECTVDADVSRPISAGPGILKSMQREGTLREYVVIALGTNGSNRYENQYIEMIDALNPGHRLVIVTPFDGRDNNNGKIVEQIALWIRGLPDSYDFITVADWAAEVSQQTDILAGDKVHMSGNASRELYAGTVANALIEASQKPAKADVSD